MKTLFNNTAFIFSIAFASVTCQANERVELQLELKSQASVAVERLVATNMQQLAEQADFNLKHDIVMTKLNKNSVVAKIASGQSEAKQNISEE